MNIFQSWALLSFNGLHCNKAVNSEFLSLIGVTAMRVAPENLQLSTSSFSSSHGNKHHVIKFRSFPYCASYMVSE